MHGTDAKMCIAHSGITGQIVLGIFFRAIFSYIHVYFSSSVLHPSNVIFIYHITSGQNRSEGMFIASTGSLQLLGPRNPRNTGIHIKFQVISLSGLFTNKSLQYRDPDNQRLGFFPIIGNFFWTDSSQ